MEIIIDPELVQVLPPLSEEETAMLEKAILKDGCLQPLVLWQEQNILVDGHNRLTICKKHDLLYKTVDKSFSSRDEVICWIYETQLARRNLCPEMLAYCRGRHYELCKRLVGDFRGNQHKKLVSDQNDHLPAGSTADRLGAIYKVAPATIRRDAKAATGIDAIGKVSPAAKSLVLAGKAKIDKKTLKHLATAPSDEVVQVAKSLEDGSYTKTESTPEKKAQPLQPALTKDKAYFDSIKRHVDELKNPDIDRSCGFADYLLMLHNHARQFAGGLDSFGPVFYPEIFASATKAELNQIHEVCDWMVDAISVFAISLRGESDEAANKKPIHVQPA